jgi:hypothetical protein
VALQVDVDVEPHAVVDVYTAMSAGLDFLEFASLVIQPDNAIQLVVVVSGGRCGYALADN